MVSLTSYLISEGIYELREEPRTLLHYRSSRLNEANNLMEIGSSFVFGGLVQKALQITL